jgi:hypothetical protein
VELQYAGSYDAGFNPLPCSPPAPLFAQPAPHAGAPPAVFVPGAYHQFDLYMTLTNTLAGEDFDSVTVDFLLGPGVTVSDTPYSGASHIHDPPPAGAGNGGPAEVILTNGDFGPNTNDLKAVAAQANNANSYARTHQTQPGEAAGTLGAPYLLGSAFVFWDGSFGLDGKSWIGLSYPENTANAHSTVTGTTTTPQAPGLFSVGPRLEWVGATQEVFQVDDLAACCGYLPGQVVVGGPLPTNDDDNPDEVAWSLLGLTVDTDGPGGNPPVPVVGHDAGVNPTTGVFTWDTDPSDLRGDYAAQIQGINSAGALTPAGTDTGVFSFRLVPEPTSITLLGLAMVGFGFIRRR